MKTRSGLAVLLAGVSMLGSSVAIADGPFDKQIKARQAIFQLYSYYNGLLGDMAKGKSEYDAEIASEAANTLAAATKLGQSTLWPQGSDNSNPENATTRALPAIWEQYPAILDKGADLQEAAAALAAEAGNGLDALQANLGAVGDSCKSCHRDFRARRN